MKQDPRDEYCHIQGWEDGLPRRCTGCGAVKPVDEFYKQFETRTGKTRIRRRCKECIRLQNLEYDKNHTESRKLTDAKYYRQHADLIREVSNNYYRNNRTWVLDRIRNNYHKGADL